MCAAIATSGLACGVVADPDELTASPVTACTTVAAGGPWWNQTFLDQTGRFYAELDATPSASSIDAVVGLGNGAASGFAQLAAVVRFNASGTIDARDGASYRADVAQAYQAGTSYHLRLDVNLRTHRYSVWLRGTFGGYTAIARNYAFRTEQAAVARLNNVASKIDSAAGSLEVCGFQAVTDATTADGCVIAAAGDGFVTAPLPDATVLDTLTFTATASGPGIDAVIGLSAGPAASFSDLATAVRLAPSGTIDARDGDGYRADVVQPYGTSALAFRVIADVTSHTYSVFQGTPQDARELARGFRFRTSQAAVTHLARLSLFVDGTQGSVTVCQARAAPSSGVVFSREGRYNVVPLPGDQALVSDGTTTTYRIDAGGRTLAQLARGGEIAADAAGNVFVASAAGDRLTLDRYDAGLGPTWQTIWPVPAGAVVKAIATDATGAVQVGLVSQTTGIITAVRFASWGGFLTQWSASGGAVALDGSEAIVAWSAGGTLRITRYDATGAIVWNRGYGNSAGITAITVDPSHALLFGGELFGPIDFGGGTLPTRSSENGSNNGFVVKLSVTGEHVFSRKTGFAQVGGIAANSTRIVVSSTDRTQFRYHQLQFFDPAGVPIVHSFNLGFAEHGVGGRVAISPSGRVWWNVETLWPLFPSWPYLVALTP